MLSKIAEEVVFLVETGFFSDFVKYSFSAPQVGERKTGISELQPGHQQEGKQAKSRKQTRTKAKDVVFENSCYSADIC